VSRTLSWCLRAGALFVALVAALAFAPVGRADAATITVTTNADGAVAVDAQCTLREAMQNAADNAATNVDCPAGDTGGDTIEFAADTTVVLASNLPFVNSGGPLTIDGTGRVVEIDGNGLNTQAVFWIFAPGDVTLRAITVRNGGRGAVESGGTVAVVRSVLRNNTTISGGGGLRNTGGTATVTDSTISGNTVSGGGGGIQSFGGGSLTVTGTTISGNTSTGGQAAVSSSPTRRRSQTAR
jgi:CSLREA domain-containing protein